MTATGATNDREGAPATTSAAAATATPLAANLVAAEVDGGRIAENIVGFCRLLRASGLPIGPDRAVLATQAVLATGLEDPKILYWTLHAVLVRRPADREVFNQAFVMFWKDPGFLEQMLSLMLPQFRPKQQAAEQELSRRVAESLFKSRASEAPKAEDGIEIEARGTFSAAEVSTTKDFEQMSTAELAAARRLLSDLRLAFPPRRTRRLAASRRGSGDALDVRRMLRETAARGGDALMPRWRARTWRRPPVVVLCDISGSMDTYARTFLHFLYALLNDQTRVHAFLFGTHLTNVTRDLKSRDPDLAIARVAKGVTDWSGGTRIGSAIEVFNRRWARRVLGQNATVLLITDGLDREGGDGLDAAARRLSASSRRLIWLNPLMRFDQYEPVASGARILARYASEMRPCHNLASLADLVQALRSPGRRPA